ncbi:MFS transporter [Flindersiella endophytica]
MQPNLVQLNALRVFFFLSGVMVANWTVRIPAVKDQVHASATQFGLALLCLSIGGLIAMATGGRLCLRFGSRRLVVVGGIATAFTLPLPGLAGSVYVLGVFLAIYGLMYGSFTIALNSAAVEAEAAAGRPIMSTLHGLYSTGSLAGAVIGGVAAEFLTPAPHLGLVAATGLLVALVTGPILLRDGGRPAPATEAESGPALAGPEPGEPATSATPSKASSAMAGAHGIIWLFGAIAFCTAFMEFANNDWAVLHLREDVGAAPSVAAFGYATYECAIAVTRLAGGRLIRKLGDAAVLIGGCLLAACGIVLAGWSGSLPGDLDLGFAFAGYIAVGIGVANIYPIAIARAGALGGPRGVSRVAPLGSIGILVERPLIGFLADHLGLPGALSTVAILGLLAAGVGIALRPYCRPPASRAEDLGSLTKTTVS